MILRFLFVAIIFLAFTPIKANAEDNAEFYIIDSGYLSYRQKLTLDAMNDPFIKKHLEDDLSFDEVSELIKARIEPKLKAYREEHSLDENGAKR